MSRTIEKTLYKFDELSPEAKEKAREWWRTCVNEDFDTDFMYDDFVACGNILGIEFTTRPVKLMGGGTRYDPRIYWSGFSSQGDGACFEGSYSYAKGAAKAIRDHAPQDTTLAQIADDLQAAQRSNFYRFEAKIEHRGNYYHSHSVDIEVFDREYNYRDIGDAEEAIKHALRSFMDWIYGQLKKEYEWRMEDEQVNDAITGNEYEFEENGKIYG